MKKIYYILTIGLMTGLAGCSDEARKAAEPEVAKAYTQFYANIVDDLADTRSMLINDKKTIFETGDKIQLYVDGGISSGAFYLLNYQTASNTFDVDEGYAPISGSHFYAIYPNGAAFNNVQNKYVVNLESIFNFRRDMYSATQLMPLWGDSTEGNNKLNFYHMAGLIRISLSGNIKVTKITLKGNNNEQIGGAAEVDYTKDRPVLEMAAGYGSHPAVYEQVMTVAESYPYVQLSASPTSFYFVVPPITFSKGITVTVEADGLHHPIVKTTTNSFEVGRGVMKSFTSVDTEAILQAEADVQLDALKALYNSTDGANWTANKWDITKPLSDATAWPGVTADAHGVVTKIALANSGLSGSLPEALGNLTYLEEFDLSNNNLSGGIPKGVKNLSSLKKFYVTGNQMNDSVPYVVYTSDAWGYADKKLTQQSGYALKTEYVSSDYSKDGEVKVLQTHDSGKGIGIPLVITCDGFSDDMYDEFNAQAINAMNYFFSIAPYKDFVDFFDVYSLMAVSPNNKVGLNIAFSTEYSGDSYKIAAQKVRHRLDSMSSLDHEKYRDGKNVLTIVLLHETKAEPNRAVCFFSSDGFAAAIVPVDDKMESIIHHEAGGHGFAFLGDEYYDAGSTAIFTNLVSIGSDGNPIDINDFHSRGVYWNVDYKNTDTTAKWKDFWTDAAYSSESVGAYPGGMGQYVDGIFHSTPKSTMLNQKEYDKFNPISRWAIYRQIIIRAGFAEPTIAQFKEYDDDNNIAYIPPSLSVVTRSNYVTDKSYKLGAPPVIEWN